MDGVAIVNSRSAAGNAARAWAEAREYLSSSIETNYTEFDGDASALTSQALKHGAGTIIAVGGDGTISEVVNGFLEDGRRIARAVLGIIPYGTGSDLIRTFKLPLYDGGIYDHPKVEFHRARGIAAESRQDTFIDVDVEPLGPLPVRISVVPAAIRAWGVPP